MVHVKIEDGRPINMNEHVCTCINVCTNCKCKEEKDRKSVIETIPSLFNQIKEKAK